MTCIAGIAQGGKVWIGGDSAVAAGDEIWTDVQEKVFRNGDMIFGCAGAGRFGDIVRYAFDVPEHPDRQSDFEYLHTTFVVGLRACFENAGFLRSENGIESINNNDVAALFGYHGVLYWLEHDFVIGCPSDGICVTGSGGPPARGALHAFPKSMAPKTRIRKALEISARCTANVHGPFKIISL